MPSISETSVDVPPISKLIAREYPAHIATCCAPSTPPAGPERIVRTGSLAATFAERIPPLDCMMRTRTRGEPFPRLFVTPGPEASAAYRSISLRYVLINGTR